MPVSYTHLDVYKRQVYNLPDRDNIGANIYGLYLDPGENPQSIKENTAQGNGIEAVSYTHLDVYKRQVYIRHFGSLDVWSTVVGIVRSLIHI